MTQMALKLGFDPKFRDNINWIPRNFEILVLTEIFVFRGNGNFN